MAVSATSTVMGGNISAPAGGLSVIKQVLVILKSVLLAAKDGVGPYLATFANKQNIDEAIRASKLLIKKAAPKIPMDLALGLAVQLSDMAINGLPEDASWEEIQKELEAAAHSLGRLKDLSAPLFKSI